MGYPRRKFLKTTCIASASLLPVADALSLATQKDAQEISEMLTDTPKWDLGLHVLDNNLLNLHFYFINVTKSGGSLIPSPNADSSFVIIRLPQMHISEKGFWDSDWKKPIMDDSDVVMSGYSYLAFRLWPKKKNKDGKWMDVPVSERRMRFTLDNMLDWNSESLDLITLVDWFEYNGLASNFNFSNYVADCSDFKIKKLWNKNLNNYENYAQANEPLANGYKKYKSILTTFLGQNLPLSSNPSSQFIPITFFEVPQGLCLVPIMRMPDGSLAEKDDKPAKKFRRNQYVNQKKTPPGLRKYEVWNNTLFYKHSIKPDAGADGPSFVIDTPSFRALGIISDNTNICKQEYTCENPSKSNILPTLLDKAELAFLTQFAKGTGVYSGWDFRDVEFDIKEVNGLFFTGLGIITHLKYYNVDKRPPCVDLIEYEHIISEGRDVYVKVARLGYNAKTGQKYKHVIEGKRVVDDASLKGAATSSPEPASFIQLKQYCECIEKDLSYFDFPDRFESETARLACGCWEDELRKHSFQKLSAFDVASNPLIAPALNDSQLAHYRRFPYRSLKTVEKERIPIICLQGETIQKQICLLEGTKWFWPIRESAVSGEIKQDFEIALDDYVPCEYEALDWEGSTITAKTPFLFIRASLLECASPDKKDCDPSFAFPYTVPDELKKAYANYFKGSLDSEGNAIDANGKQSKEHQRFFDRRKTFLKRQFVAYAPAVAADAANTDAPRNKSNIVETEFFETYFVVRNPAADGKCEPAQKIKYIVLPQVLRFKGYTDHVRDYTHREIPQVMEYHENFIACRYNSDVDVKHPETGKTIRNYGTLAFANTDAFMRRQINGITSIEESANATYEEIKNALQQAKDKLGNLVVPDIVPDTISLEKFGITVPKEINESIESGKTIVDNSQKALNKIASFNPRELLRGKLSDVCGLDLTAILDELLPAESGDNQTPLFEINKIANEISDAVLNSEVYKEINDKIQQAKDEIAKLEQEYKTAKDAIDEKRLEYNTAIKQLAELVPNANDLRNIFKTEFENLKTKAFNIVFESTTFEAVRERINEAKSKIEGQIKNEISLLKSLADEKYSELVEMQGEATNRIMQIETEMQADPELRALLTHIKEAKKYFDAAVGFYKTIADAKTIEDLVKAVSSGAISLLIKTAAATPLRSAQGHVYFNTSTFLFEKQNGASDQQPVYVFDLPGNAGYLQLEQQLNLMRLLLAKNAAGNVFQQEAVAVLSAKIVEYETQFKKAEKAIAANVVALDKLAENINLWLQQYAGETFAALDAKLKASTRDNVLKIRSLLASLNPYIDVILRIDPYFYYKERERIDKEIIDAKRRIASGHVELYKKYLLTVKTEYDRLFEKVTDGKTVVQAYVESIQMYYSSPGTAALENLKKCREVYLATYKSVTDALAKKPEELLREIAERNPDALKLFETVNKAQVFIVSQEETIKRLAKEYTIAVTKNLNNLEGAFINELAKFINEHPDEIEKIREAQNLYRLLTSIKQQDLSYTWSTTSFRDINLGAVSFKKFSSPNTALNVNVKTTAYFSPGKFPPALERVTTYSENRFTNFGIGFFNCLTVSFSEISFIAGSEQSPHFDVKIKDVKFDGALSFVQAFEKWLQTIGKGLILQLNADHVALGYSLQIPAIKTPGFNIFNLSLNLDLRVYYDNRPLRFGFSLARPESKFAIAVGIYAGFGFFGIVANPKKGIVEVDIALEAGAWAGISIGPISGEVKLAFGFRYTKNEFGVRLEGYIVAEGRLKVWILEVSARIYLGVVSENSYVEGMCTVTYSVKLGFVKKSFSGTFRKHIAGAKSNNTEEQKSTVENFAVSAARLYGKQFKLDDQTKRDAFYKAFDDHAQGEGELETQAVSEQAWEKFITIF